MPGNAQQVLSPVALQLPPELVRAELDRVLSSRTFATTESLRRFLRFVVEEKLAGRAGELKEYVVGAVGLERGPAFDPRNDSIVRVEAVKLRRKLAAYYAAEGQADTLRIELPKGTYVPSFARTVSPAASKAQGRRLLPVTLAASVAAGAALWFVAAGRGPAAAPVPASLAVLPFANLTGDAGNEHIGDGLADELISSLSANPDLRVVARSSAFQYKNKPHDVRAIGRELRVGAVVEGTFKRTGRRMIVSTQLINVADGFAIWSHQFDRDADDMAAVQREIATAVAGSLRAKSLQNLTRYSSDPRAHDAYMRGLWLLQQGGPANLEKSAAAFQEAIAADPKFALAHAQLAVAFFEQESIGYRRPHDVMPKAREAASRALALDPMLPEAHLGLGMVKVVYEWDWDGGCRAIDRSLELNPGNARAHVIKAGLCLSRVGKAEEARAEVRLAQMLDPAAHATTGIEVTLAIAERKYDAVIERCRKILEVKPDSHWVYSVMANIYSRLGNIEEAKRMVERARASTDDSPKTFSVMAQLYARTGQRAEALRALRQLHESARRRYVPPTYFAVAYASLPDSDSAFEWLEKAYEERSGTLTGLRINAGYDPIREDPRFAALLAKMRMN